MLILEQFHEEGNLNFSCPNYSIPCLLQLRTNVSELNIHLEQLIPLSVPSRHTDFVVSDCAFTLSKSLSRFPLDHIWLIPEIESLARIGFPMLSQSAPFQHLRIPRIGFPKLFQHHAGYCLLPLAWENYLSFQKIRP